MDFDVTQCVQEINIIVFANRTIAVEAIRSILLVVVFMDLPWDLLKLISNLSIASKRKSNHDRDALWESPCFSI